MRIHMAILSRKIRNLRLSKKQIQSEFADTLGVGQATVSRWESGKETPILDNISKLAKLANERFDVFYNEYEHDYRKLDWPGSCRVIAAVQAGEWLEAVEWDEYDQFEIGVPLPSGWPDFETQGFLVRGSSMNEVYPDGSIVIAASTITNEIQPKHGDRVIVQRKDNRGLYEVTLKELQIDDDGLFWLWPKSTVPKHQGPIDLKAGAVPPIDEITMTGIVVASVRVENPIRFSK